MIKKIAKLNRKFQTVLLAFVILLVTAVPAFAEGTADTSVTAAFTTLKDDVIATLGVVAGLAVGVMAIFLAWKYGRKIFNQVAK